MRENLQVSGTWNFIFTDRNGNEIRRRTEKNKIVDTGLTAIAAMVVGEVDQDCAVWLGLGTGTTAAAATDTELEKEIKRKIATTKTHNSGVIVYRFYFLTNEANSSHSEWGVYWEGTSRLGVGRLINRLVPSGGVSKSSNENLIIEVRIALTAA